MSGTITPYSTDITVPNNWSLKPSGLGVGDEFRLIFLSSTKRNASSDSIGAYNTFVQGRAEAGHDDIQAFSDGLLPPSAAPEPRMPETTPATTYTSSDKGVPIYWLNGNKVADEYEDFYDGSWDNEANDKNELGAPTAPTHLQLEQLPLHRLRPRRHGEIPDSRWHAAIQIPRQQPR